MELVGVLIANAAGLDQNGLLNIQGAGWEYVPVAHFPWVVAGCVTGVVEFGADELGQIQRLHLTIASGSEPAASGSTVAHAMRHRCAFVIPFSFVATDESVWEVRLATAAGDQLALLTLPIRHEPPALPGLPS